MVIRDRDDGDTTLDITLVPGRDFLLILDAVNRGESFSFVPKLEFDRK